MKKLVSLLVILTVVTVAFAGLATKYTSRNHKIGKLNVPQLVFPDGATGATLTQTQDVTINGTVTQITVGVNDNTDDATVIVSLVDADGSVLYTAASTAEDTNTAPVAQQYMTQSGTDLPLRIPCSGVITVTGVISADPNTSTGLCDVTLYCE